MADETTAAAVRDCPSCAHIGRSNGREFVPAVPPIDAGHSPLAHRLYRIFANHGITSHAQLVTLTDADFLDLRNAGVSTLALLRSHYPAPGTDVSVIRVAFAELQAAGLNDLRGASPAVVARCAIIKRLGHPAAQSLVFLQRIVHDFGDRLAANLGPRAVDDLTESLIRHIAAVAVPAGTEEASEGE